MSSIEWFPQKIEVIFYELSGLGNMGVREWITDYPDLNSETSWRHGDLYSVLLDIDNYPTFINFYNLVKNNNEAVIINGKIMSILFRLPFPVVNVPNFYN
jgi:hypothetical protein